VVRSNRTIVSYENIAYTKADKEEETMSRSKYKFSYDEIRIIVLALVELKNKLIAEGRYTDALDDLLIRLVD